MDFCAAACRYCDAYFYHAAAHLGSARNGYNPMMPENGALQKLVSQNIVSQSIVSKT